MTDYTVHKLYMDACFQLVASKFSDKNKIKNSPEPIQQQIDTGGDM